MKMEDEGQSRQRFLMVCQGFFCMGRGSWGILAEFRKQQERGELPEDLKVQPYFCFNGCSHGPNVVCYPEKVWFERVSQTNLLQVLAYVKEGTPVSDQALNQRRVLEVVRNNAYAEIEQELKVTSQP